MPIFAWHVCWPVLIGYLLVIQECHEGLQISMRTSSTNEDKWRDYSLPNMHIKVDDLLEVTKSCGVWALNLTTFQQFLSWTKSPDLEQRMGTKLESNLGNEDGDMAAAMPSFCSRF